MSLRTGAIVIIGWPGGTAKDAEDCMQFAVLSGIRPMVEKYSLKNAAAGYERHLTLKSQVHILSPSDL